jgi:hypothetical protein
LPRRMEAMPDGSCTGGPSTIAPLLKCIYSTLKCIDR